MASDGETKAVDNISPLDAILLACLAVILVLSIVAIALPQSGRNTLPATGEIEGAYVLDVLAIITVVIGTVLEIVLFFCLRAKFRHFYSLLLFLLCFPLACFVGSAFLVYSARPYYGDWLIGASSIAFLTSFIASIQMCVE
ncbi:unnamed protein product [Dicrocoelium dendriticum]|nr:unnamed protein product [Dicrocoelium dendriticum]